MTSLEKARGILTDLVYFVYCCSIHMGGGERSGLEGQSLWSRGTATVWELLGNTVPVFLS